MPEPNIYDLNTEASSDPEYAITVSGEIRLRNRNCGMTVIGICRPIDNIIVLVLYMTGH